MRSIYNEWALKNYPATNGLKAFGAFICGGGSTMGYKLAGFEHLGGVEIDKRMAKLYQTNHQPKHLYVEDIRDFNQREDLPQELYELDLLDGSPPCTTFSMAGKREKTWGKTKKFAEGQKEQRLDDLVFEYCKTINKLQPKVAVLENVPGLLAGRAKGYAIKIHELLDSYGYQVQIFSLNSALMGVPQARERVFFIARRKDLNWQDLKLSFNQEPISTDAIIEKDTEPTNGLWPSIIARLPYVEWGDQNLKFADAKYRNKKTYNAFFSTGLLYGNEVPGTLTSGGVTVYYPDKRCLHDSEYRKISSFPVDYDFCGSNVRYICGMSVPPLMTKGIAEQIVEQWF